MGGDAFLIPVTPSAGLLEQKPGFLARLLGARPKPDELSTASFRKALWNDFRAHLRERLPSALPATKAACDYLDTIGWSLYLRRYAEINVGAGAEGWFLQITWSGCAGTAETSAALAAHWTRLWWEARSPVVSGLVVDPSRWPERQDPLFVPVEGAYVMWTGDWEWDDVVEPPPDVSGLAKPERCGCQLCECVRSHPAIVPSQRPN